MAETDEDGEHFIWDRDGYWRGTHNLEEGEPVLCTRAVAIYYEEELGQRLHVMKAQRRCLTSAGLGVPSCANGALNRDTLLEVRHQLIFERHYADIRRPFADIRQHGSASWRIVVPKTSVLRLSLRLKAGMPPK